MTKIELQEVVKLSTKVSNILETAIQKLNNIKLKEEEKESLAKKSDDLLQVRPQIITKFHSWDDNINFNFQNKLTGNYDIYLSQIYESIFEKYFNDEEKLNGIIEYVNSKPEEKDKIIQGLLDLNKINQNPVIEKLIKLLQNLNKPT